MNADTTAGTDAGYETVLALMSRRSTCRRFTPDPVPDGKIRQMLELAQKTASWANVQPWDVILTKGQGTERFRAAMYEAAKTQEVNSDIPYPEEFRGKYRDRRRENGFGLYDALKIDRKDAEGREIQRLENYRLFGAPHFMLIHSDIKLGGYAWVDCGAYIATILLAAQSLGIAAAPQAAIAMYSKSVHDFFDLPEDRVVVAGVSFGYAAEHPVNNFRTTRAEIDDVVTWFDR